MSQKGIVGPLLQNAGRSAVFGAGVAVFACFCGVAFPAEAAPPLTVDGRRPSGIPMPRVVLLHLPPPESAQAQVQRLIAAARAQDAKRHRGASASPEKPVSDSARLARDASRPQRRTRARKVEEVTPAQMRAVADALLIDALSERLPAALRIAAAPAAEVTAAEASLHLSPADVLKPVNAVQVCRAVGAGALLFVTVRRVAVQEADSRDAALWAEVRLPYRRAGKTDGPTMTDGFAASLPAAFPVSGAGSTGRKLFRSSYVKSRMGVLREAVQQAAAQAVSTLRTGRIAPLAREGERVAVAPVFAPSHIDKLLFSETGRRLLPDAVPDLPADVSASFAPELLPQFPDVFAVPETLRHPKLWIVTPPLWGPQDGATPDTARVQAWGRLRHVDYVLLARVTDIELETGPPEESQTIPAVSTNAQQTDARAEAVGAFVRVADGALLWHDRATAAVEARPSRLGVPMPSDRQIVGQSERFALLQLQRLWRHYRAGFEQ